MIKLANFTRHDQSKYILGFKLLGFDIDPAPRAPTANFKKMSEEKLITEISARLSVVKNQGFDAILIGGLTNCMIYAWYIAQELGLDVYTARFKSANGRKRRTLAEVRKMLTILEVIAWERRAKSKAPGRSARLPGSSAAGASPSPARRAANSPGM